MDPVRNSGRRRSVRAAILWMAMLAGLIPAGCATGPSPADAPSPGVDSTEARAVLERLQQTNEKLKNFKGVGRLTVKRDGKIQMDERLAWIGSDPSKLSIVLFASGFPAVRMVSDGEWLYYQDGQEPGLPVKKIRSSDPDFDRLLSISIHSSDIIALLRGRTPIREHRSVRLVPVASGNGYALLLDRIWGVHQKIFINEQKSEVQQIEVYDVSGRMLFQANFLEMQQVGGYRVPGRLVVSNHETNAQVQLVVEKYWADVPVSPSMFVLEPPG
ncbi:MAG TPA: DUF4292 domain-containing protein [Desulfobacterales bacterium]|nr:DUF4292 domain-containing protein [Desulfobacterales bacterium]